MTLDEYIDSIEDDIELLESTDTSLYCCCDMAEHNVYLEVAEMVLANLKTVKEKQGTNMQLSAQAYKRKYEQTKEKLNKLNKQLLIESHNTSVEFEYKYITKLRSEYAFSLADIIVGSEWYDKQTNEYIGKVIEVTNHETHPYLMDNKHSYHPKSILEWFRLKDK